VRAMTRCANHFGGEVRGIIGDRVMVLFDTANCFENAIDTAELMNSVCEYVINSNFSHNEVKFGIGIDYGRMLATKTGIRKHGDAQSSYRSLVWLGRPANIASKLTDNANKDQEKNSFVMVKVAYRDAAGIFYYQDEYPHVFVRQFTHNGLSGLMMHNNPEFHSFSTFTKEYIGRELTPPILMTKAVYDGFRASRPSAIELKNGWFRPINVQVPEYDGQIYGGNVIWAIFKTA
jgi:adenylate cyclase